MSKKKEVILFIEYQENRTGGEIRARQENNAWPDYEPEYIDVDLRGNAAKA